MKSDNDIKKKLICIRSARRMALQRNDKIGDQAWLNLEKFVKNVKNLSIEDLQAELTKATRMKENAFNTDDETALRVWAKTEAFLKWYLDFEEQVCKYCHIQVKDIEGVLMCPNCYTPFGQASSQVRVKVQTSTTTQFTSIVGTIGSLASPQTQSQTQSQPKFDEVDQELNV